MTIIAKDGYGRPVDFSTDKVTDTYLVGDAIVFTFPAGTKQQDAILSITLQTNISRAQPQLQAYIADRYSLETRLAFHVLLQCAQSGDKPLLDRIAYIMQLMTWEQAAISYGAVYIAKVSEIQDPFEVAKMAPDFTQIPDDPMVTTIAAISIQS